MISALIQQPYNANPMKFLIAQRRKIVSHVIEMSGEKWRCAVSRTDRTSCCVVKILLKFTFGISKYFAIYWQKYQTCLIFYLFMACWNDSNATNISLLININKISNSKIKKIAHLSITFLSKRLIGINIQKSDISSLLISSLNRKYIQRNFSTAEGAWE